MTILQLSSLYNLLGLLIVILVAAFIRQRYPHPVYRWWFQAYVAIFILAGVEIVVTFSGRLMPLNLAEFVLAPLAGWLLFTAGEVLEQRQPNTRLLGLILLGTTLPATAMALMGVPYSSASLVPFVVYLTAYLRLGWVLIAHRRIQAQSRSWMIGGPVIAFALWTGFAYPMLENTPAQALGFAVAAFLQMVIGVGMVVFLLEESTRQIEEQNQQLQKLDAMKSQFLSIVSHELRTPLTSIKGYLELLEDGIVGALSTEQDRCVRQAQANTEVLRNLIESIITAVQSETFTLKVSAQAVDLDAAILQATQTVEPLAQKKGVPLKVHFTEPAWVQADPLRLTQVLLNLLGNAVKYSEPGHRVHVEVTPGAGSFIVAVRDEGKGIPAGMQPHVFDPFFQVDGTDTRSQGGMGLGLAIAKNLVAAMGGEIGVSSEPGKGSTFWFTLPASKAPVEAAQA